MPHIVQQRGYAVDVCGGIAPAWSALRTERFDAVLLDLGLSSLQLDDPVRGFAFQAEGPLDMRFDPEAERTAAEIVNDWPLNELADIVTYCDLFMSVMNENTAHRLQIKFEEVSKRRGWQQFHER